ncbi:glucosaminidase domain-containing protein [Pelagicoccus sp. SDUM812005]|nr:glucosaminidase domain-containing protein [Pelagicoccus sp. SDUM812005]
MSFLSGVSLAKRSDYQTWMFVAAGLSLLFIAVYSVFSVVETIIDEPERSEEVRLPNFSAITSTQERKQAFFEFLEPFVAEANGDILEERAEVLKLQAYFERNQRLNGSRLESFNELREAYKLDPVDAASPGAFRELLARVDTIPTSLALAQAAIESGWGTSRFARQGNNLFGMWCYEPGCGLVPKRRSAGKKHEVTVYRSPRESFLAYLHNLNTGAAYEALRDIRAAHRENGVEPTGRDLAPGLVRYSQERWTYVDKVRGMISANRLDER